MTNSIDIENVITRLKDAAGCATQSQLSRRFGHKYDALANGVARHKREGGLVGLPLREAVQLAMEEDVSLDWLIFGREPKAAEADPVTPDRAAAAAPPAPGLSVELVRSIVTGVEGALADTGRNMTPENKADLVASLVEIYAEAHAAPSRDNILRLVRSAS